MDEKSFKKLLDETIAPLKKYLSVVKSTQTQLQSSVEQLHSTLSEMKDTLDNRVLPSVTEIEVTIKSYADSYKINKHNIERVDTRLTTVEDKLNIEVPEDLKVPHFANQY